MNALSTSALPRRIASTLGAEHAWLGAGLSAAALLLFLQLAPVEVAEPAQPVASATLAAQPAPAPLKELQPLEAKAVAAASTEGLILRGVFAGSGYGVAILGFEGKPDMAVSVGVEFLPGLRVTDIGASHAVVASGSGNVRLEVGRGGAPIDSDSAAAAISPAGSAATAGGEGETRQFEAGLQPVKSNGRISGFAVKPGAAMPQLQRAGLQPGDVLVAVNGQAFESEEKLLELSHEIATSRTADFTFIRGGRRMKASLKVNTTSE